MKNLKMIISNAPSLLRLAVLSNFPWSYPIIKSKIIIASLKITENCNSKCPSCNFHKTKTKQMEFDQWIKIIDQLNSLKIKNIRFSGGEPLLRPDIFKLLGYTKKLGCRVTLQSNILLLDEKKIFKLAEIGIDNLSISIDGVDNDYIKTRGSGSFAAVSKTIYTLRKYFQNNIGLTPTLNSENINGLFKLIQFAKNCKIPITGFNLVNFTHYFFSNKYNRKTYDNMDQAKLKELLKYLYVNRSKYLKINKLDLYVMYRYFQDYRMTDLPCLNPLDKICIGSNGDVYGCCSQEPAGNLLRSSLNDLINSEKMKELRFSSLNKSCPGCSCFVSAEKFNLKYHLVSRLSSFF